MGIIQYNNRICLKWYSYATVLLQHDSKEVIIDKSIARTYSDVLVVTPALTVIVLYDKAMTVP